jgi:surface antigen
MTAKFASLLLVVAFAGLSLAACAADAGRKETGAGTGPAAGSVAGGAGSNRLAGPTGGGGFGGFLGGHVGAALDDDDKRRAYAAQMQALETGPSGAPVAWRNPESGRYGNVVPGPVYQFNGASCRQYTHTVYVDGLPQTERGTACRNPDGTWSIIS